MPKQRLDSWKSIAKYLDRGQRTVQRWHAEHGLPVHHFGGTQGCVFAYADDLDAWLSTVGTAPNLQKPGEGSGSDARGRIAAELVARADEMWTVHSENNLAAITELYREALGTDPGNVRALAGIANTMIAAAFLEVVDSSVAHACAMSALQRVPQSDSLDADAKCTAALLKIAHERKWRQAKAALDELLTEHPSHPMGLVGRGFLHIAGAECNDALRLVWEAWRQNPLVSSTRILLCWVLFLNGCSADALDLIAQFKSSGSSGGMLATVEALALSQAAPNALDIGQIEALAAEFPESRTLQGVLGYAYGVLGQTERASQQLNALHDMCVRKKANCGYALAIVLIGLDRKLEAIPWLETSFKRGSLWSLGFRSDAILKPLRGNPRFESLLRKIGCQTETVPIDQPKSGFEALPASFAEGARNRSGGGAHQRCLDDFVRSGTA